MKCLALGQHHFLFRPMIVFLLAVCVGPGAKSLSAQSMAAFNVPMWPKILPDKTDAGQVSVTPESGVAGEYGTWTGIYRVGERTIHTGGGLRVQLPEAWFAGPRNSPIALQATEPNHNNYVGAGCSNPAVKLETTVELQPKSVFSKDLRPSNMTNREGYYDLIVRVIVLQGELHPGDTLSVIYGDRTGGGDGMRAGLITTHPQPITLAIDFQGRGQFQLYAHPPKMILKSGLAREMLLTAPSEAVLGKPSILHLAVLDRFHNPAASFAGDVDLRIQEGEAEAPARVHLSPGRGWGEVTFVPRRAGVLRIEALEKSRALQGISNPILVLQGKPGEQIYWGDVHSHTRFSVEDGVGNPASAYEYARYISGLDFYSMSDHARPPECRIMKGVWQGNFAEYNALADRFDVPGKFVTLHAYEASFYPPYGHVIVYFRGDAGPLLYPDEVTLPEAWRDLTPGQALTISHHTLKMPDPIDWSEAQNPEFRRNIEIYSSHGSSEEYHPSGPLAFEQSLFTNPSTSQKTGLSAREAWVEGYRLSTVAGSDNHRAHPGQPGNGITAVIAPSLSRESVFDAMFNRRTYATTGVRIILNFEINQVGMGGSVTVPGQASIHVRAIGTDIIDRIDVLRHPHGHPGFQIIHQLSPAREQASFSFIDRPPKGQAIYYVRLRQRHLVRGHVAMAWSSPIWVSVK
ncbi:MAG TPA: DUF3604 domain-containing protein [Terriglobia bacterium]|nr:DUF3604 domain-containing protein [Terriglobia bacterium]